MTTSSTAHPRQPKGQPTGGQFAAKSNPEADIELEPSWPGLTREVEQTGKTHTAQWRAADGRLQDPPDGSPAVRWFRPDGVIERESHWQAGHIQDPPNGSPAVRRFRPDGTVQQEEHWQAGDLQDPPDGAPAVREFSPDGTVYREEHWQDGNLQDPPDGSPAVQRFRSDGSVKYEEHCQAGKRQDPPDGSPAAREFHVTSSPPLRTGLPGPVRRLTPPPDQMVDASSGRCDRPSQVDRAMSLHVLRPPVRRLGC